MVSSKIDTRIEILMGEDARSATCDPHRRCEECKRAAGNQDAARNTLFAEEIQKWGQEYRFASPSSDSPVSNGDPNIPSSRRRT